MEDWTFSDLREDLKNAHFSSGSSQHQTQQRLASRGRISNARGPFVALSPPHLVTVQTTGRANLEVYPTKLEVQPTKLIPARMFVGWGSALAIKGQGEFQTSRTNSPHTRLLRATARQSTAWPQD